MDVNARSEWGSREKFPEPVIAGIMSNTGAKCYYCSSTTLTLIISTYSETFN